MRATIPSATYRVQLTREFGFRNCAAIVPYLSKLGISTLYCSPVLQAVPGSTHGYDTVDSTRISEDLGGTGGWAELLSAAQDYGMTLLLDIVPNHMAATLENPWWRDLLEYGRISPYACWFDIDWEPPERRLRNRVMLPVLPTPLEDVITSGQLAVHLTTSGLMLHYGETDLPLDLRSYRHVLTPLQGKASGALPAEFNRLVRVIAALHSVRELPGSRPDLMYELRSGIKRKLLGLLLQSGEVPQGVSSDLIGLVRSAAVELSVESLRHMLHEQHYVLDYWKSGRNHVNYRRFFEINDLVGMRVEEEQVYKATHALLEVMSTMGPVIGFRVDHIDGLRLPLRYLTQLRSIGVTSSRDSSLRAPYVVVEKILSVDEVLPTGWPVEGTTGYDFLNEVAGLFISPSGLASLRQHDCFVTHMRPSRRNLTYDNKRRVLKESFQSDLSRLAHLLLPVARWLYPTREVSVHGLAAGLTDVTAALPVYRTYYAGRGILSETDRHYIESALQGIRRTPGEKPDPYAQQVVRLALTLNIPDSAPAGVKKAAREHLLRWQQLSGAAMAKGFEDTTLYQDSTLLALNTVGGRESLATTSLEHFHTWNEYRQVHWPHTMNCTATHDTKRGEDVRARLSVLSEIPDVWSAAVGRWLAILAGDNVSAPLAARVAPGTQLFLLQSVVGAWPEGEDMGDYANRLVEYMMKVAREAKTHSSWLEPDEEYETALEELVRFSLEGAGAGRFRECFGHVISTLRYHGLVSSLGRVLLKITCPGVPDSYQGTELPELSLVDPDNRRPVDYPLRESLLAGFAATGQDRLSIATQLAEGWPDARAKLYTNFRALQCRRSHIGLFHKGSYRPLYLDGALREHVCAFMRAHRGVSVVVAIPLRSRAIAGDCRLPLGAAAWGTEAIILPAESPAVFENVLTGENVSVMDGRLRLWEACKTFPVALLLGRAPRQT